MKNRPLVKLFALNVLTLGLYELVWLSETRQEMVATFGAKVPKARYMVLVRGFQIIAYLAIVVIVLYFIPATNRAIDAIPRPSAECFIEYAKNTDAGLPIPAACKHTVDNYYDNKALDQQHRVVLAVPGLIVSGLLSILLYVRWCNHYAAAVAQTTAGKISQTMAMFLLLIAPPTIGMIIIQNAFNSLRPPEAQALPTPNL